MSKINTLVSTVTEGANHLDSITVNKADIEKIEKMITGKRAELINLEKQLDMLDQKLDTIGPTLAEEETTQGRIQETTSQMTTLKSEIATLE